MSGGSRKRKRTEKVKLSTTLQDWFDHRVRLKQKHKEGLTVEQARVDIIKDACIRILSPLPLNVFASAINRLAQYEETDQLYLAERLLVLNRHFDMVSDDRANVLREYLVATLSPSNDANGATTIEIDQKLMDVAKTVLQQSHRDWIGTREALSTFLKDCTAKFHSEKNVFIVHPHLSDISRKLFLEKKQRTSVEYFFACIQNVANSKGLKFKDLIRTEVPSHKQAEVQKLMDQLFPNGIQLENDDCINDPENTYKRRIRSPLLRPRCYKQQHMILLTLRNSPDYTLARDDLIDAAISLDEKLNAETGLPRCFTGEKPRSFASACLTKNAEYFTVFKKPDSDTTYYYKLSFIPNDRNDAIKHYNQWMKVMIEHDWPLCFGKPKKSSGQDVQNNGHILMLSVGAIESRCRRCISETSCDEKLPACSKCKSGGHLCIYPFRIANQNHHNDVDTRPATATRNKKKMRQLVEQKESEDYDECRTILPDEILDGLDLTNVPKSLNDVVEVRSSTIANTGNGLFAKRDLPIGTPLGFYFGVPMLEDEFDHLKDKVGEASYYSMRYKYTILDATDEKGEPFTKEDGIFCPFHFMNEDPSNPAGNMVFLVGNKVNQIICCTKLDIQKGEELFFEVCKNTKNT